MSDIIDKLRMPESSGYACLSSGLLLFFLSFFLLFDFIFPIVYFGFFFSRRRRRRPWPASCLFF